MPWPNFVIIGAAKSGTSSLYNYLDQHPEVYVSPVKEPRFLAPPSTSRQRVTAPAAHETEEQAYLALFEGVRGEKAVGEASPGYLYKEGTAARMHRYVPEARLIAVLRHPVERAYSNYISLRGRGAEPITDFEAALEAEQERIARNWSPHWFYRRNGLYARQLTRFLDVYPRGQLHIGLYEDLKSDPVAFVQALFRFLEVDDTFVPDVQRRHNSSGLPRSRMLYALTTSNPIKKLLKPYAPQWLRTAGRWFTSKNTEKPDLSPRVRKKLTEKYYREDLLALQTIIDRDLSGWLK